MTTCEVTLASSTSELIARLNTVIRQNMFVLVLCLIVLVITIVIVMAVTWIAWGAVNVYTMHTNTRSAILGGGPKSKDEKVPNPDDAVYVDTAPDGLDPELPDPPEAVAIGNVLRRVKGQYAAYNRAIRQHELNKGRRPQDLVDEKILSAAHDDYRRPKPGRGVQPVYLQKENVQYGDTTSVAERRARERGEAQQ